ncbi:MULTISPECIES: ATP-binding protein [Streptomyces]|uniref:ORC1/DEAH AAA+ ATPase domain-containing protein n=2 Tax=Streptomyces TaxID=1883 RepID=A0A1D8FX14_9ACTN|nr:MULTISPECIES: ATP-binding protein [Streptomyces]AOT57754.1 hypothetical protein A4G23_00544 [Streptomyces rubrolavendulae]OSY54067.1 hypothetical protein BG846_00263 [Streptomyces fradiae ATCC 10745 = DSM 40063]QEV11116.1 ATP-binding protein [Streptomyces fradiae ATCC 10745 = DSM 40063]
MTALAHPLVREGKTVHLTLAVESAELRIAVGPQSDTRLHELFEEPCATVVRTALEREQAWPGHRSITYNPMDGLGPDTVLLIEDHALREDGEGRRGPMLSRRLVLLNRHQISGRRGLIVTGQAGTGKTTAIARLGLNHELLVRKRLGPAAAGRLPVVYVTVPPRATPKMLAIEFARFLGLLVVRQETQTSLTDAVCGLLIKMRVELALVDEIHNLNLAIQAGPADLRPIRRHRHRTVRLRHLRTATELAQPDRLARRRPTTAPAQARQPGQARRLPPLASFTSGGSGSASVLSDAPLRLDVEEGNGRGRRDKHCTKARQYGSPLLPVLRVDPV